MAIFEREEIIAWREGSRVLCLHCGGDNESIPLTEESFDEGNVVVCDSCGERIQ